MCRIVFNPYRDEQPQWGYDDVAAFVADDIAAFHRTLDGYLPTPLLRLRGLAASGGVGAVFVKDESQRLGLNAFKVLGASYGIYRFLRECPELSEAARLSPDEFLDHVRESHSGRYTFCAATDGNHGRAVAWMARQLRQRAEVYVPSHTVEARVEAIRGEGAEVVVVDGDYDTAVERVRRDAGDRDWQIISDTSWPGYERVPRWIMAGYTTLFREIHELRATGFDCAPDLVLVQGGVGALAAAVAWYYGGVYDGERPRLVVVEPTAAACLQESITSPNGRPTTSAGDQRTIMAGLNCATPSPAAWPLIRAGFDAFLSISDDLACRAMRLFHAPHGDDPSIVAGESGAAGLAGLLALLGRDDLADARARLGIGSSTRILLINTEGDTDPAGWRRVVGE